jgi:cytochrome c oxidase assembly protein Cox11
MIIEPEEISKYITRHQCLCFQQHKLKAGESVTMQMEFEIGKGIETHEFKDKSYRNEIKIRFKI